MKIEKKIIKEIMNSMPNDPPEIGGIIGGCGGIINTWMLDIDSINKGCSYAPNVSVLNNTIYVWQTAGIEFMGMFHVHFWGIQTLSDGDKSYIIKIMQAMPKQIGQLYFPVIVIPDMSIKPYIAQREKNIIHIQEDVLIVV